MLAHCNQQENCANVEFKTFWIVLALSLFWCWGERNLVFFGKMSSQNRWMYKRNLIGAHCTLNAKIHRSSPIADSSRHVENSFDPVMPLLESQLMRRTLRFAKGEIFGLSFQEEWYVLGADDDFVVTAYVGNNLQDHVLDSFFWPLKPKKTIFPMNLYAICPVYTCWQILMLTAQLQLWCLPSEYQTLQSAQDAYKGQSIRSIYWTEIDWNEVKSTEGDQETHFFSWGASDELNYFHTGFCSITLMNDMCMFPHWSVSTLGR